jgi:hypothetical protein
MIKHLTNSEKFTKEGYKNNTINYESFKKESQNIYTSIKISVNKKDNC